MAASAWVTAGLLAGRLAGILREFLIADTFGVSRNADVAILLVTGPDLLVTIAGTGAVGLVLIPILLEHDVGTQLRLVRRLTLRLGALAVVIAFVAGGLVIAFGTGWATGPNLTDQAFRAAVILTALAVPPSMVVVLTASFLRAQDRFAVVSLSTVIFTLPILVAIVTIRSVAGVAIGIAIGAILRYLAQAVLIGRGWTRVEGVDVRLPFRAADMAASFGISIMLAAQVSVPLMLAAVVGEPGDVAVLNYGWRILLIPIGLLGSILSVAAYPAIIRSLQEGATKSRQALAPILMPVVFLSWIVGAWLWVNSSPAIGAIYGPAGLDDGALRQVANGVRAGAIAIPLITVGTAATTLSFGLKQPRLGLIPYLMATLTLVVLGAGLSISIGPTGLMLAISGYAAVLCGSATLLLYRSSGFAVVSGRDVAATLVLVAGSSALAFVIRALLPEAEIIKVAINGTLYVGLCLGAYYFIGRPRRRITDASGRPDAPAQ